MTRGVRGGPVFQAEIPEAARATSPCTRPGGLSRAKRGFIGLGPSRPRRGVLRAWHKLYRRARLCIVGGPPAADLDVELAIPAEYRAATTPKHWRRPDARAGTPPYYVSPIADVPPTEV